MVRRRRMGHSEGRWWTILRAPSVRMPESVIPSAAQMNRTACRAAPGLFPDYDCAMVLLPERFRGGCSFGAGDEAGLSRCARGFGIFWCELLSAPEPRDQIGH